jgi:glycosyltransferase involved in cell wall biosynthesis
VTVLKSESNSILIDARCLQDPNYMYRGIGQFGERLLQSAIENGAKLLLLVDEDRGLGRIPADLPRASISRAITDAERFNLFIQLSPMTAEMTQIREILQLSRASVSIVYDFIPARHAHWYLNDSVEEAVYRARLQLLSEYEEFWCISEWTKTQLEKLIPDLVSAKVVWPDDLVNARTTEFKAELPQILVATGNEWRKNWRFAVEHLLPLVEGKSTELYVMGVDVDSLSEVFFESEMPPYVHCGSGLDQETVNELFLCSRLTVVPSLDEGLSLPVIESMNFGTPIVASDIPVHRELIGNGEYLFNPKDEHDLRRATALVLNAPIETLERQQAHLAQHRHTTFTAAIRQLLDSNRSSSAEESHGIRSRPRQVVNSKCVRKGLLIVAPLPPAHSGVADFTLEVINELSQILPVTVAGPNAKESRFPSLAVTEGIQRSDQFLASISILGNSHYHLDSFNFLRLRGGVAVCHDVRMNEFNLLRFGQERATKIANINANGVEISSADLIRGVQNIDCAQNLGFGLIAQLSSKMIFHSETILGRVRAETGHSHVDWIRFPHYRQGVPHVDAMTASILLRRKYGIPRSARLVCVFGGVDIRTKASDTCIEAHEYLQMWGSHSALVFVGDVAPEARSNLQSMIDRLRAKNVFFTGRIEDSEYQEWLEIADVGMVLRNSPILSLSGAAVDLLAHGVPSVFTEAIAQDCGTASFIETVPQYFTGLLVAEALLKVLSLSKYERVHMVSRRNYLQQSSIKAYCDQFLSTVGIS